MSGRTPPLALPRELVLASAGSGKTYRLSNAIIQLLAAGAPASEMLASTFTRKAAGEILERVLVRLARGALDADQAQELGHAAHETLAEPLECRRLLSRVLGDLHLMNVGTLDAFLVRVARCYFQDLDLAPGWTISDLPTEVRLRTEAVQSAMADCDRAELVELIRMLNRGEADRQVHASLLDRVDELLRLRRQIDPAAVDPWTPDFGVSQTLSVADLHNRASALADHLRELDLPKTKAGSPNKSWEKARDRACEDIATRGWAEVFGKGIGKMVIGGHDTFSSKPIAADFVHLFNEVRSLARADLAPALQRETRAMGKLAALLEHALEGAQRRAGAYRFEDITFLLGGPDPTGGREDLHYRLDQQIRHLLLDEFQDTSLEQWRAMEPLAHELLSGHLGERAGVIVADTKQSIYGWRGARPELVRQVGEAHGLTGVTMDVSWRSSPVVLRFVDSIFHELDKNPVISRIGVGPAVAADWMKDFTELRAAQDLPGHVSVHLGPETKGRKAVQGPLLRRAAELVKDLHERMPDKTIGVLARRNSVIGRLMDELHDLGVQASGEGGTTLTDTAPANAILSLIRLADHPGDRAALYHVATTPLGAVVGFADWRNATRARTLATHVRRLLLTDGYGHTLGAWVRELAPRCDAREVQRLLQLVELGHRWDERPTLRPADFARYVSDEPVEDPSSAPVKVMTVHRSKGLEFDVVVLPDLYASLAPTGTGVALAERGPNGLVEQVYPNLAGNLGSLFPELAGPTAEMHAAELRDSLSVLYVALTRAKYALHLVLPPQGGSARHSAGLIREALGLDDSSADEDGVLMELGDPHWFQATPGSLEPEPPTPDVSTEREQTTLDLFSALEPVDALEPAPREAVAPAVSGRTDHAAGPLLRAAGSGPGRNLARRSPSSLEGGDQVDLGFTLRLDRSRALRRGRVVHAWCERIEWIEDGTPDDETLQMIARDTAPELSGDHVSRLASDFRNWLEVEAIRSSLTRDAYSSEPDTLVRVENELPFARRMGAEIHEGFIDRLVLIEREGQVVRAEVLDFKTDDLESGEEDVIAAATERHRPQIQAYCGVVRGQYGLAEETVVGKLLFLQGGVVREIT